MPDVEVRLSGPLLEGRAPAVVERMAREAEDAIAAQVYAQVMTNLNTSIQYPTPYYETQITNERLTAGRRVHDRGIVYGPWLEHGAGAGRGSVERPSSRGRPNVRYRSTGRFRGYRAFGRAREQVEPQAQTLAEFAVQRHLRELGG